MKLTIKSSEWLRGKYLEAGQTYNGFLYDPAKKCFCVQGLYCKELGVPGHVMEGKPVVCFIFDSLHYDASQAAKWLVDVFNDYYFCSDDATKIASINDDPNTSDAEKIDLLRPIFTAHGVEIEYREDL